jgi:NTP pyrophosphatase (non-canonical NTP hydrolase)
MRELEAKIYKFLQDRKWDNLRPSDLAKSIMIEGAELLELFQWENLPLAEVRKDKKKLGEIKKELADVFIYALQMSVLLKLDTKKIISQKLAYASRKYPAKLMRQRQQEPGTESLYWHIKQENRRRAKV